MLFKGLEYLIADGAAFLAQRVVHPDTITADIYPAAAFEVRQVA